MPRAVRECLARYRPRPRTVTVLLVVSVALMAVGIDTSDPAVIWVFAAVWPLTGYSAFRLLCRWTEPSAPREFLPARRGAPGTRR